MRRVGTRFDRSFDRTRCPSCLRGTPHRYLRPQDLNRTHSLSYLSRPTAGPRGTWRNARTVLSWGFVFPFFLLALYSSAICNAESVVLAFFFTFTVSVTPALGERTTSVVGGASPFRLHLIVVVVVFFLEILIRIRSAILLRFQLRISRVSIGFRWFRGPRVPDFERSPLAGF
ncbi:hypothetical protein BHE74_00035673 [Ensete ventricosum]|nr:hypothetical protein BHE74_00035673 [Ensete ventricosum]